MAKAKKKSKVKKTNTKSPENRRRRKAPKTAVKKGEHLSPATEWKPGVSPNPGGRPKKTPITDAYRKLLDTEHPKHKGKTYAQVIAEKALDLAVETGDLATVKEISDRVEGKVAQVNRHEGSQGGAIEFTNLSPEENEAAIAALLAEAAGDGDSND